jgi:hypothetical protein
MSHPKRRVVGNMILEVMGLDAERCPWCCSAGSEGRKIGYRLNGTIVFWSCPVCFQEWPVDGTARVGEGSVGSV